MKTGLLWVLRIGLGGMFVVAGALKLGDPNSFALEIHNYQVLPQLAPFVAATLPGIEVVVGLALIAAPRGWARAAAWVSTLVLVVFTLAVTSAVVRGVNITCGCFGEGSGPVTIWTVLRDVLLVGASVVLMLLLPERASTPRAAKKSARA